MNKIDLDISPIFDPDCEVYCIKLATGETILAKSKEDTDTMHIKGTMDIFGAMVFAAHDEIDDGGKISRVNLLTPWMQGAMIDSLLPLPLDMVVQIVPCKPSIKFQYNNMLLAQVVKDQVGEERFSIIREEMERKQSQVTEHIFGDGPIDDDTPLPEVERPHTKPSFYAESVPEREPERISPEEIYSEQQESEEVPEEMNEPKTYQVNGVTIH